MPAAGVAEPLGQARPSRAVSHAGRSMGGHIGVPPPPRPRGQPLQHGDSSAMTDTIARGAANQAGARVNKDAYAEAQDFLPLKGIDHVEFWVGNARQASALLPRAVGLHPDRLRRPRDRRPRPGQLRDAAERHHVRPDGAAHAGRRDRRARPSPRRRRPRHRLRRRRRPTSAWRETTKRGARPALEPAELDGGEDGVLRRSRGPHLRRGHPLVHRPERLPRRLRAGLPQGQEAGPAAATGSASSRSTTASATSGSAT